LAWSERRRDELPTVELSSAAPMEGRLGVEQFRREKRSGLDGIRM
jgi:predicted subunit of tRNA(5-methylaminomethyl-2-thiouridylate) methyltransferase